MKHIFPTACFALVILATWSQPQPVAAYQLGKPFTASLQVPTGLADKMLPGDTLGGFEVLVVNDTTTNHTGRVEVMLLPIDTGRQLLPISWHPLPWQRQYTQVQVDLPPNAAMLLYQPPLEIIDLYPDEAGNGNINFWWLVLPALVLALAAWLWWRRRQQQKHALNLENGLHPGELLHQTRQQWQAGTISSMQLGHNLIKVLHYTAGARHELTISRLARQLLPKLPNGLTAEMLNDLLTQTDAWRFGRQVATDAAGMECIDIAEYLLLVKEAAKPNAK
jgi:hypothetical protein